MNGGSPSGAQDDVQCASGSQGLDLLTRVFDGEGVALSGRRVGVVQRDCRRGKSECDEQRHVRIELETVRVQTAK